MKIVSRDPLFFHRGAALQQQSTVVKLVGELVAKRTWKLVVSERPSRISTRVLNFELKVFAYFE